MNGFAIGVEIDSLMREQIAATLTRLASTSALLACEVAATIERLIRFDADRSPRGLHALLALLLELRSAAASAMADPQAIACLSAFSGSSKDATHARALLALVPGSSTSTHSDRERLRWRVERAERWLTQSSRALAAALRRVATEQVHHGKTQAILGLPLIPTRLGTYVSNARAGHMPA